MTDFNEYQPWPKSLTTLSIMWRACIRPVASKRYRLHAYSVSGETKYLLDFWRAYRINAMCWPKKGLKPSDVLMRAYKRPKLLSDVFSIVGLPF